MQTLPHIQYEGGVQSGLSYFFKLATDQYGQIIDKQTLILDHIGSENISINHIQAHTNKHRRLQVV